MKFLARLVDLAILNVLTLLYSVPLITLGGAQAAMHYVLLHLVRGDETYVGRMFVRSFRENFRQGAAEGLMLLAIAAVTVTDLRFLRGSESRSVTAMMIIITIVAAFIFIIFVYIFALQSRYENSLKVTVANAVKLAIGNLPKSLLMALTWLIWGAALVYLHGAAPIAFLLYGLTLPSYICSMLLSGIFAKLEEQSGETEDKNRLSED